MADSPVKKIKTTLRVYPVLGVGRHYSIKIECFGAPKELVEPTTYIHFGSLELVNGKIEFNEVGDPTNGDDFVGPRHLDPDYADRLADRFAGQVSPKQSAELRKALKGRKKKQSKSGFWFSSKEIDILMSEDGSLEPKDSRLTAYYTPAQWEKVKQRERELDRALAFSKVDYNFISTNSTTAMRTYLGEVLNWPLDVVQNSFSRSVFAFRLGWRYKFDWASSSASNITHPIRYNDRPVDAKKKKEPWFRGEPIKLTDPSPDWQLPV